jgi:hypothetical protein
MTPDAEIKVAIVRRETEVRLLANKKTAAAVAAATTKEVQSQ